MNTGIYQHYKGGYYQLLGVAEHSETNERMAVYVSLDTRLPGPRLRVRPMAGKNGFTTPVGSVERFTYIGDELSLKEPQP